MQNIQLVFLEPTETRQASYLLVLEKLVGYSASPRGTHGRSSIYVVLYRFMQDYVGLYRIMYVYAGLRRYMQDYVGCCRIMYVVAGLCRFMQDYVGL